MRKVWVSLFALLLSTPAAAGREEHCNDPHLVVDQTFLWDFTRATGRDLPLPTLVMDELRPTRAFARLASSTEPTALQIGFGFPVVPGEEVGLPYNVYELELLVGDEQSPDSQRLALDFTADCTQVGPSMFPGGRIQIPAFALAPHADGSPRAQEPLRVRIWGGRR